MSCLLILFLLFLFLSFDAEYKTDQTTPNVWTQTRYLWNMNISPTRRFRCGVGSLDNDSDEDPEIEVSANSTSCGISITHHAFPSPSKRQKMNPANERVAKSSPNVVPNIVPEATADGDQTPGEAIPVEEKKRNQV